MKLRHLEMKLSSLAGFMDPSPSLEQYLTPAPVAARLLYTAYTQGDIFEKKACDLGCGTGILGIGAALLGAKQVIGVDADPSALKVAADNARQAGVTVLWREETITGPVPTLSPCDTVIMNPPFGAQKEHADRPFLDAALAIADTIYGIFNAGSLDFIRRYVQDRGTITDSIRSEIRIRNTFAFHTRDQVEIPVEILIIRRNK